ncbi:serpin family protein, partial [Streptomyces badius]
MTDVSTTSAIPTTRAIQHLAERWIQDGMTAAGAAVRGRSRTVPPAGFVCSPAGLWLALAAVAAGPTLTATIAAYALTGILNS